MDLQSLEAYKSKRLSFSQLERILQGVPEVISVPEYLQLDKKLNDANTDILSNGSEYFTIGKSEGKFQMWKIDEKALQH